MAGYENDDEKTGFFRQVQNDFGALSAARWQGGSGDCREARASSNASEHLEAARSYCSSRSTLRTSRDLQSGVKTKTMHLSAASKFSRKARPLQKKCCNFFDPRSKEWP